MQTHRGKHTAAQGLHPILIGRLASLEIAACKKMNINYDYVFELFKELKILFFL